MIISFGVSWMKGNNEDAESTPMEETASLPAANVTDITALRTGKLAIKPYFTVL
jgi:hypothetical protein